MLGLLVLILISPTWHKNPCSACSFSHAQLDFGGSIPSSFPPASFHLSASFIASFMASPLVGGGGGLGWVCRLPEVLGINFRVSQLILSVCRSKGLGLMLWSDDVPFLSCSRCSGMRLYNRGADPHLPSVCLGTYRFPSVPGACSHLCAATMLQSTGGSTVSPILSPGMAGSKTAPSRASPGWGKSGAYPAHLRPMPCRLWNILLCLSPPHP